MDPKRPSYQHTVRWTMQGLLPRKAKTLILVLVHHMMSVDEYPQNFNKGMKNFEQSKFNNSAPNGSK